MEHSIVADQDIPGGGGGGGGIMPLMISMQGILLVMTKLLRISDFSKNYHDSIKKKSIPIGKFCSSSTVARVSPHSPDSAFVMLSMRKR